jgi:ribosomal protein L37AE/L43A
MQKCSKCGGPLEKERVRGPSSKWKCQKCKEKASAATRKRKPYIPSTGKWNRTHSEESRLKISLRVRGTKNWIKKG